jgi:hypothetical protein
MNNKFFLVLVLGFGSAAVCADGVSVGMPAAHELTADELKTLDAQREARRQQVQKKLDEALSNFKKAFNDAKVSSDNLSAEKNAVANSQSVSSSASVGLATLPSVLASAPVADLPVVPSSVGLPDSSVSTVVPSGVNASPAVVSPAVAP